MKDPNGRTAVFFAKINTFQTMRKEAPDKGRLDELVELMVDTVFTFFHSHNCRRIFPISLRFSPKNTLRRYFGANTMWYLQFHFVCAKLFVSFILE